MVEDLIAAEFNPNDMRVLERRGTGLIAVPMAISENGRRAGTRERIRAAAQATARWRFAPTATSPVSSSTRRTARAVGVRYVRGAAVSGRRGASGSGAHGPAEEVRASAK